MTTTDNNFDKLKDQVLTWSNRAVMARQQSNNELVLQALDRCWKYQRLLAPLMHVEEPPMPESPEEVWKWLGGADVGPSGKGPGNPGDPYQPSGVPRKPLPFSGAGAAALPLPDKKDAEGQDD